MKDTTERDIEGLLRGSIFSNPSHKSALRQRLFERKTPLSLEDLDKVVGGAALIDQETWKPWPEVNENVGKQMFPLDPRGIDDWLQTDDRGCKLYFICSFDTQADQVAWHAYYGGYPNACSIGGLRKGLHID